MNPIFSAANALDTLTTQSNNLAPYVLAVFGVLAGLYIAIRWFKRGVSGVAAGKVK